MSALATSPSASVQKPLPGGWTVVALLWFVACLNYLDRILVTTMRGSLKEAIPMTEAQFGLLTTIFLVVYGLCSPLGGFLADRFKRSHVVIVSALIWSAVTWLTGRAETFEQLLWARGLMGLSESCYMPAALALIADYHRGGTRSLATGIHMTGTFVGASLGGLGGWFAEREGWSYAFSLFGLSGIGYSLVLALMLRDAAPEPAARPATTGTPLPAEPQVRFFSACASLLTNRSFHLMLVFWALFGVAGWVILGWMPTYLTERFALTQGVAGLSATGYFQMAALLGVLAGGYWADRWSVRTELARIYVPALGLGIAAIALFTAATASVLPLALAGLFACGLTRAFTDANMMPILCLVAPAPYRATGYGILNLFGCLAGGAMIYLGGALRDAQIPLGVVFASSAGCLALGAIVLLALARLRSRAAEVHNHTR